MRKSKYTADSGPRPGRNTTTATHRGIIIDSLTIACGNEFSIGLFIEVVYCLCMNFRAKRYRGNKTRPNFFTL